MEYHPTSCDEVSGSSCLSRGTLCAFSNPVTTACTSGLSPTSTGSNPTEKPTFSDTKGTAREQAACVCLSVRKACSTGHRLCSATVVWKEAHGRRARRVMSWQSLGTLARTSQAKTIVHWDRWERITGVHRLWLDELLLFVNLRHTSRRRHTWRALGVGRGGNGGRRQPQRRLPQQSHSSQSLGHWAAVAVVLHHMHRSCRHGRLTQFFLGWNGERTCSLQMRLSAISLWSLEFQFIPAPCSSGARRRPLLATAQKLAEGGQVSGGEGTYMAHQRRICISWGIVSSFVCS